MATPDSPAGLVSGNERLRRILSDPELRAQVDMTCAEQQRIDDRHQSAVHTLRRAVAAVAATTSATEITDVLEALQRRLAEAGVREVGITLTYGDHEVTAPLDQVFAATYS